MKRAYSRIFDQYHPPRKIHGILPVLKSKRLDIYLRTDAIVWQQKSLFAITTGGISYADVAKIILGSIITIGGFYSLTVILFTL